jgi:hypothetical protein
MSESTSKKVTTEMWDQVIENWSEKRAHDDHGNLDCAFCKRFYSNGCLGCPIFEDTKSPYCRLTVYEVWRTSLGAAKVLASNQMLEYLLDLRCRREDFKHISPSKTNYREMIGTGFILLLLALSIFGLIFIKL